MACTSCGRTDGPIYHGEWISSKSETDTHAEASAVPNMTVCVTRTTYSDFAPLEVHLCGTCFGRVAAKYGRKSLLIISGFFALLSAGGAVR